MQTARIIHPLMALNLTIHKQTVQTNQSLTIKETHPTNNILHYLIIITNQNKIITYYSNVVIVLIDDW